REGAARIHLPREHNPQRTWSTPAGPTVSKALVNDVPIMLEIGAVGRVVKNANRDAFRIWSEHCLAAFGHRGQKRGAPIRRPFEPSIHQASRQPRIWRLRVGGPQIAI